MEKGKSFSSVFLAIQHNYDDGRNQNNWKGKLWSIKSVLISPGKQCISMVNPWNVLTKYYGMFMDVWAFSAKLYALAGHDKKTEIKTTFDVK